MPAGSAEMLAKLSDYGQTFYEVTVIAEWPTDGLGLTTLTETAALDGVGRILAYLPPQLTNIWPDVGTDQGGTEVYVRGIRLDLGLYQTMLCRFGGTTITTARVVTTSSLIVCVSPSWGTSASVLVEVSVDGLHYFAGAAGGPIFNYVTDPVFDATAASVTPSRVGVNFPYNLTVVGSGFPASLGLAPGYPLCRFGFTTTSAVTRLSHGAIVSATEVRCPTLNATEDPNVELAISYNGVEFHTVLASAPLVFAKRPAVSLLEPPFRFADTELLITATGSRLEDARLVGYTGLGSQGGPRELPVPLVATSTRAVLPGL